MKKWNKYWMALVTAAGLTSALRAQLAPTPVVPGPAVAGGALPGATAMPAAAPTSNLWSFLFPTPEQKMACKLHFCSSPFGKIFTGLTAPVSMFSGGLFGNCCPQVQNAADLAQPADSPTGAAARIKADEAAAAARRADIRYLGTVDCRRWPEAELALINALRADRNECVRLEAAWALNRGCCCTRKTLEALALTVSGSERDGNPAERSERVRAAAGESLSHCLSGLSEAALEAPPAEEPIPPPSKEGPKEGMKLPPVPDAYYKTIDRQPMKKVAENARRALAQVRGPAPSAPAQGRSNGVIDLVARAFTPSRREPLATQVAAVEQADGRLVPAPQSDVGLQTAGHFEAQGMVSLPAVTPAGGASAGSPYAVSLPIQAAAAPASPVSGSAAPQGQGQLPAEMERLLAVLQYGATPEDRQTAAEALTASTWSGDARVLGALGACGRDDASPAVRATCLRCVARINFNNMPQ